MKKANAKKRSAKPKKNVKRGQPATETSKVSKKDQVLAGIQRDGGAMLNEIMTATGGQKHGVRGFISGTVTKKLGHAGDRVAREKSGAGYRVTLTTGAAR